MWPRGPSRLAELAFRTLDLLGLILALSLGVGGALPRAMLGRWCRALKWGYRLALVVPLVAFVAIPWSRLTANALYAAAPFASRDLTPLISRLEGAFLARIQGSLQHGSFVTASVDGYSLVWVMALLLAVPALIAGGRPQAVSRVLVAWALAPVLALPAFLLIPVYEPWALNPAYGYAGIGATELRFLVLPTSTPELRAIARDLRWAAGACLPSLHVALPLVVSRIAFASKVPVIGWLYAAWAAVTAFIVIHLGRHWVVDVVVALPFAWLVAAVARLLDPGLVLAWPPGATEPR